MPVPKEGEIAPDFEMPEASEKIYRLSEEVANRTIVLMFYPTGLGDELHHGDEAVHEAPGRAG